MRKYVRFQRQLGYIIRFLTATASLYLHTLSLLGTYAQTDWRAVHTPMMVPQAVENASSVIAKMNSKQLFTTGAYMTNLISASLSMDYTPVLPFPIFF
jgi:uncharacterized membrane protein